MTNAIRNLAGILGLAASMVLAEPALGTEVVDDVARWFAARILRTKVDLALRSPHYGSYSRGSVSLPDGPAQTEISPDGSVLYSAVLFGLRTPVSNRDLNDSLRPGTEVQVREIVGKEQELVVRFASIERDRRSRRGTAATPDIAVVVVHIPTVEQRPGRIFRLLSNVVELGSDASRVIALESEAESLFEHARALELAAIDGGVDASMRRRASLASLYARAAAASYGVAAETGHLEAGWSARMQLARAANEACRAELQIFHEKQQSLRKQRQEEIATTLLRFATALHDPHASEPRQLGAARELQAFLNAFLQDGAEVTTLFAERSVTELRRFAVDLGVWLGEAGLPQRGCFASRPLSAATIRNLLRVGTPPYASEVADSIEVQIARCGVAFRPDSAAVEALAQQGLNAKLQQLLSRAVFVPTLSELVVPQMAPIVDGPSAVDGHEYSCGSAAPAWLLDPALATTQKLHDGTRAKWMLVPDPLGLHHEEAMALCNSLGSGWSLPTLASLLEIVNSTDFRLPESSVAFACFWSGDAAGKRGSKWFVDYYSREKDRGAPDSEECAVVCAMAVEDATH